ncbi:MAG: hypothetical protein Fur0037_13150 [Planctomycetota bacterium]
MSERADNDRGREAECLRIRALLRDYADGDLDAECAQEVDEHVHACRSCALRLGRVEHETWLLRSLGPEVAEPPADFVRSTMRRIRAEVLRASAGPVPVAGEERPRRFRGRLLAVLVAGAAILVLAIGLFWHGMQELDRSACLVASTVRDVVDEHGRRIGAGERIASGHRLRSGADGGGVFRWLGPDGRTRATMRLGGAASLELAEEPLLLEGGVSVESQEPVAMELGDGTRIEMGTGRYFIDAADYRAFDAPLFERLGPRLRVTVEVVKGEAVRIQRGGSAPEIVSQQEVASYEGFSPLEVEPVPGDEALGLGFGSGPRVPLSSPDVPPALTGLVVEGIMGTMPAVGARVATMFQQGGLPTLTIASVDARGVFRIGSEFRLDGDFALVQVEPPPERQDLGGLFVQALPLVRDVTGTRLPQPLVLSPSVPMGGVVIRADSTPIEGVRLLPCVVDELFGSIMPLWDVAVDTGRGGEFVLRRLPPRLGPHQQLGVLLLHAESVSRYEPLPLPGSIEARSGSLVFELAPLRRATIEVPSALRSAPVEVIEELPGAPAGTAVRRYALPASIVPQELWCGGGRLWLKSSPADLLELKSVDEPNSALSYRVVDARPVDSSERLRRMQPVAGLDVFRVGADFRQRDFSMPEQRNLRVRVVDEETGRVFPLAEVYAASRHGVVADVRFLGITDAARDLSVGLSEGEGFLVAVGSDGRIGWTEARARESGTKILTLRRLGSLVIGAGLRVPARSSAIEVRFRPEREEGGFERQPFVRHAVAGENWVIDRLAPGRYTARVGGRDRSVRIEPGRQAVLE